jgi:hypothetical protein
MRARLIVGWLGIAEGRPTSDDGAASGIEGRSSVVEGAPAGLAGAR